MTVNTWTLAYRATRAWVWSVLCIAPWIVGCVGSPIQYETESGTTEGGTPTRYSATSTPTVEPSITARASATVLPPAVALGEDCGQVEHLEPASAEAQRMVAEFERAQAKRVPFDPLVFEAVYDVLRQDGYLMIVGQRYETNWFWAGEDTGKAITPLGAFVQMNGVTYSRFVIHDFFSDVLPEAPSALFGCYVPAVLPPIESDDPALIIDPEADCTKVERPDLGLPKYRHFVQVIADEIGAQMEWLQPTTTAWSVGEWTLISATFKDATSDGSVVDGAYLVRPPNDLLFSAPGPIYSRRLLMREIYQAYPAVPRLLLSCAQPMTTTHLQSLIDHGYYAFANKAVWERTPMP